MKKLDNAEVAQVWFNLGTNENNLAQLPYLFEDDDPREAMYLRGYVVAGIANNTIDLDIEELRALAEKAQDKFLAPPAKKLEIAGDFPRKG